MRLQLFGWLALVACQSGPTFTYDVPLAADAPWPRFRRDSVQDGASPVSPAIDSHSKPWQFATGKGVFSSPIIGTDDAIYVGSGDRSFYALEPGGTQRFKFDTQEIIDSAAVLDDSGRVFVPSGDGSLYALDAKSGDVKWTFTADDPSTTGAFIRWFEGNVIVGQGGELVAPNDNFRLYGIDRDTGKGKWRHALKDVSWSAPALRVSDGRMFFGNNDLTAPLLGAGGNFFAIGPGGSDVWNAAVLGSVVASPLLAKGLVFVGAFDGVLRAYDQETGALKWSFTTRDHLYASPALLKDDTVVQASADGTVYALDALTGTLKWAYDSLDPIRSSPAIDGNGNIYVGTGGGSLLVLGPDGARRWRMKLSDVDRNDLNASPALGRTGVVIAGEDGNVSFVPYEWCLRDEGKADTRCEQGGPEELPSDGVELLFTTAFGSPLDTPPTEVGANDALAFSLFVRKGGDTQLAHIKSDSVMVAVDPPAVVDVTVSGDRKFIVVAPVAPYAGNSVQLTIDGDVEGGAHFTKAFSFSVRAGAATFTATTWEWRRLAVPLPTILPSYNQIGFDSLEYQISVVEPGVAFVVGATKTGTTVAADPTTHSAFALQMSQLNGAVTLESRGGFSVEALNAVIPFDTFRIAATLGADGTPAAPPTVFAVTLCSGIPTYGTFLRQLGFCNPDTDQLAAYGSVDLVPFTPVAASGVGTAVFSRAMPGVQVTISGSTLKAAEHHVSVLLIDAASSAPLALDYGLKTTVQTSGDTLSGCTLDTGATPLPAMMRAYLMIDGQPAAMSAL
jgi:outer membrane protein assembly factor BamB